MLDAAPLPHGHEVGDDGGAGFGDLGDLVFGGWDPISANALEAARTAGVLEERDLGPTDQKLMVDTFIAAASAAGIPAPRRPWLDELEPAVDLASLRHRTDARLPIGVTDLPGTTPSGRAHPWTAVAPDGPARDRWPAW